MRKGVSAGVLGLLVAAGAVVFNSSTPALVHGAAVCDVTLSTPTPDRLNTIYVRSGESLTVTITGKTSRCKGGTVSFFTSENGAAEVAQSTATADASAGTWSKNITLTDAVTTRFYARMTGGGRTTEAKRIFSASTALPKLVITAPWATEHGVFKLVEASASTGCGGMGNIHVAEGMRGYVADTSCSADGQVPTSFTVTGANGGTVDVSYDGVSVYSSAASSTPQTFTPTLTLPDLTRGDLVFSATNGSGTTSTTYLTQVLVAIPPNTPGPDGGACCVFRLVDVRAATVEMDYMLPTIPSAVPGASIHLHWTTSTVIGPSPLKDGGSVWATIPDGGAMNLGDGGILDITALTGGFKADGGSVAISYDPRTFKMANGQIEHSNGGYSRGGLIMQIPNDCVLYDPSASPQLWNCRDGSVLASGSTRTAVYHLPPLNTYYLFPLTVY